jgi:hypothetical protein
VQFGSNLRPHHPREIGITLHDGACFVVYAAPGGFSSGGLHCDGDALSPFANEGLSSIKIPIQQGSLDFVFNHKLGFVTLAGNILRRLCFGGKQVGDFGSLRLERRDGGVGRRHLGV